MIRSQGHNALTIGEFAAEGGVGVETVRFYQRTELLRTPARAGSIRHYDAQDVRRLRFIRHAQTAGFTLKEIRELLDLDAGDDRSRARQLASARIKVLDDKIAELARARDSLRQLASKCAEGTSGPCPILASFDL